MPARRVVDSRPCSSGRLILRRRDIYREHRYTSSTYAHVRKVEHGCYATTQTKGVSRNYLLLADTRMERVRCFVPSQLRGLANAFAHCTFFFIEALITTVSLFSSRYAKVRRIDTIIAGETMRSREARVRVEMSRRFIIPICYSLFHDRSRPIFGRFTLAVTRGSHGSLVRDGVSILVSSQSTQ